jgi:Domain of unknown function DUF29
MARHAATAPDADLYESDYYAWALRQAELLRQRRFADLDLENLIEEVEDLARSDRRALESLTETIIEHLLKLAYSPAREPRRGWRETVVRQRLKAKKYLTPTLRNHLQADLADLYADGRRVASLGLQQDNVSLDRLPADCPYSLDQILDPDWLPDNVHGLNDGRMR